MLIANITVCHLILENSVEIKRNANHILEIVDFLYVSDNDIFKIMYSLKCIWVTKWFVNSKTYLKAQKIKDKIQQYNLLILSLKSSLFSEELESKEKDWEET